MAFLSFGATISADGDDITGVKSISVPERSCNVVEVTHLGMTDPERDYIAGLNDSGELEIEAFWDTTLVTTLEGLLRTEKEYIITSPDTNGVTANGKQTFTFDGILTSYQVMFGAADEVAMIKFKVKPVEKPTHGVAS